MKFNFYDIESLKNVFTLCNVRENTKTGPNEPELIADVFYLCDDLFLLSDPNFEKNLKARVYQKNQNFNGPIELHDLRFEVSNRLFATTFGLSDAYMANDPKSSSSYPADFRLVCDTDPNYDEDEHPYLMGYNSYNYDTTMLAMYFYDTWLLDSNMNVSFHMPSASQLREYNDELFSPRFKASMPRRLLTTYADPTKRSWAPDDYSSTLYRIRQNMLFSGRHLDVARLNEKQSKVGLKRLLGMLGYQILESDKLSQGQDHIDTTDQLYDLIAYNISDCINLKMLFGHKYYQAQFSLKRGLLKSYPEIMYQQKNGEYAPDIRPSKVRRDRLTIDSSSAQFATKSLCPYGHLTDMPVVSFMYPSEEKSKETGVPRVNILEESKKFFYSKFQQPELRAKFDIIYDYYKSIEGKNFNESKTYYEDYGNTPKYQRPHYLSAMPKADLCMPYYKADGTPSSCFVTFSTGGIHGAELNSKLFESHLAAYQSQVADMDYVKSLYPDPIDLKKVKEVTLPDGRVEKATKFLKSGSTLKCASYKDLKKNEPVLFTLKDDGSTELNKKYVYTSCDLANHEDFTSYYPNLLIQMSAFFNKGLGYDRYKEIFDNKQKYGKLMNDESLSKDERELYSVLREGTKLILNSASGAGDTNFEGNIRMNNTIISMRIIGQLFSWRIGQAQTIEGAKITSTNTDGLYSVLEEQLNAMILERESKNINVGIEPEPIYLISKDSNNRLEMNPDNGKIVSASGGTLGCRKGPTPTKALAHPAIIDWALSEYLVVAALKAKPTLGIYKPFDDETGMNILLSAKDKFEPVQFLTMMQNVIASSVGSMNYIFNTNDASPGTPIIMQHYNRVFILKDNTPGTVHLRSAFAKSITPAMKNKRAKLDERAQQHDPLSLSVLNQNGVTLDMIPSDKEAVIKKVTNIEEEWYMFVQNKDLNYLSDEEYNFIIDNLDYDKYLQLLRDCFESNWRNKMPDDYSEEGDDPSELESESEPESETADTESDTTTVAPIITINAPTAPNVDNADDNHAEDDGNTETEDESTSDSSDTDNDYDDIDYSDMSDADVMKLVADIASSEALSYSQQKKKIEDIILSYPYWDD
jgi:hypothetical protein